jgi:hypothetical protein
MIDLLSKRFVQGASRQDFNVLLGNLPSGLRAILLTVLAVDRADPQYQQEQWNQDGQFANWQ